MIDGGPLRISRATTRQGSYRRESARRQPEEPEPMEPSMPANQPQRTMQHRQVPQEHEPSIHERSHDWVRWILGSLIIAVIIFVGWFWVSKQSETSLASTIDSDKYQAVFLSNGQVYFGKLELVNNDYMKLSNIYYLERQVTTTSSDDAGNEVQQNPTDNNFQLLRYSDVLYGSEDEMIISKDDIIRYENLRNDGVVAKAIANRQ